MAARTGTLGATQGRHRRDETNEVRILYAVGFIVFLVATIVSRLMPWRWRELVERPAGGRSIFGEARAATETAIPFAFMG